MKPDQTAFLATLVYLAVCCAGTPSWAQSERFTWSVYSALNNVQGVMYDSSGAVWAATTGGVVRHRAGDSDVVYRTTDGLLSLNCTAIAVDPRSGDVYVGAQDGTISIRRAAGGWGYSAEVASLDDRPARRINAFAFGDRGAYVATSFGVGLYDAVDSVFLESYLRFGPWPTNISVNALVLYKGRLWLGTDRGLTSADLSGPTLSSPASWVSVPEFDGDTVTSIAPFDGHLVIGTSAGAFSFDGNARQLRSDLPVDQYTLVQSTGDRCVASVGATAYVLSNTLAESFAVVGQAPEWIRAIASNGTDGIVIGMTKAGLGVFIGDSLAMDVPNAPVSNRFTDLALADDGAIWAASADRDDAGAGVSRLSHGVWSRYTAENTPELLTNSVWSVGSGAGGSVWAGTFGGGVVAFSPREDGGVNASRYDTSNSPLLGIPSNRAFVLVGKAVADLHGRTWMTNWDEAGTVGPILVARLAPGETGADGSSWSAYPQPAFRQRPYKWLAIDDYGTKWVGADLSLGSNPGLVYLNDNNTPADQTDDESGVINVSSGGLLSDRQTALAVDHDGELWIGTPIGISVLVNPGSVVLNASRPVFRTIAQVRDQFVRAIAVDALNRKWIATEKGVVVLSYDGLDVVATFSTANSPIVNDDVRSLLADEATGDVYIGTINGLSKVTTDAVVGSRSDAPLKVSPQPFRLSTDDGVRIEGLPENAIVKILTPSGALVRELVSPGGAVAYWDGRDNAGHPVGSGVYVVAAASSQGDVAAIGKVAVIGR